MRLAHVNVHTIAFTFLGKTPLKFICLTLYPLLKAQVGERKVYKLRRFRWVKPFTDFSGNDKSFVVRSFQVNLQKSYRGNTVQLTNSFVRAKKSLVSLKAKDRRHSM